MRENKDQNNSEYGHFSRSVLILDLSTSKSDLNLVLNIDLGN